MQINISVLNNMTDEELLKVCVFDKPESMLTPTEHLLVEMGKRLESSKDAHHILLDDIKKLKEKLSNIGNDVDGLVNDHE